MNNGPLLARSVAAFIKINIAATAYAGVGLSFGALVGMLAAYHGREPWPWFLLGSVIPPGPLAWMVASDWMMERKLRRLRKWRDENLIDEASYERVRKEALDWYGKRWFRKELGKSGR